VRGHPVWPWVVAGLVLSAVLLVFAENYRASQVPSEPLLTVAFEHIDHTETQCADCHHNFIDKTGGGTCYNCHKYTPEIAADIEKTFHDFCFACHVARRKEGEESGPMRACSGCHKN